MAEHHLVVLAANPRLLVAAEGRVRRIEMVAIGPHSPSLDGPAKAVGAGAIASPDSGAKPIERVVGDGERLFIVLEFRHRKNGSENFFLENAHLVVAFENRRL